MDIQIWYFGAEHFMGIVLGSTIIFVAINFLLYYRFNIKSQKLYSTLCAVMCVFYVIFIFSVFGIKTHVKIITGIIAAFVGYFGFTGLTLLRKDIRKSIGLEKEDNTKKPQ